MRLNPASFKGMGLAIAEYPAPVLYRRGTDVAGFYETLKTTTQGNSFDLVRLE